MEKWFKTKKSSFHSYFPYFEKVEEHFEYLSKFRNLTKEGRPKINNSSEKLIFGLKPIDKDIEIILLICSMINTILIRFSHNLEKILKKLLFLFKLL